MNLNLGLESLVVVKQQPTQRIDLVLALEEYLTHSAELEDMLTGYQNADAVLKLKKAGKLTPDMLELIGVENMQAIAAMEGGISDRWQRIKAAFIKIWKAFVLFIKGLFNRNKSVLATIKQEATKQEVTNIRLCDIVKQMIVEEENASASNSPEKDGGIARIDRIGSFVRKKMPNLNNVSLLIMDQFAINTHVRGAYKELQDYRRDITRYVSALSAKHGDQTEPAFTGRYGFKRADNNDLLFINNDKTVVIGVTTLLCDCQMTYGDFWRESCSAEYLITDTIKRINTAIGSVNSDDEYISTVDLNETVIKHRRMLFELYHQLLGVLRIISTTVCTNNEKVMFMLTGKR